MARFSDLGINMAIPMEVPIASADSPMYGPSYNILSLRPGEPVFNHQGVCLGTVYNLEINSDPYCETRVRLDLAPPRSDMNINTPRPSKKETNNMFTTTARLDINDDLVVTICTPIDGKDVIIYETTVDMAEHEHEKDPQVAAKKSVTQMFLANLRSALA